MWEVSQIWLDNYLGFTAVVWDCIKMGYLIMAKVVWEKSWRKFANGIERHIGRSLSTWRIACKVILTSRITYSYILAFEEIHVTLAWGFHYILGKGEALMKWLGNSQKHLCPRNCSKSLKSVRRSSPILLPAKPLKFMVNRRNFTQQHMPPCSL